LRAARKCVFAHPDLLNREEMMDRVVDCLSDFVGVAVAEAERINRHHNFIQSERHFRHTGVGVP
jgi:tRNA-splicing ligase RtcB